MSDCSTPFPSVKIIARLVPQLLLLCACIVFLPQPAAAADNLKSLFNFQTKMAAHGSSEAMIKLGEMCEEGLGTERNEERAREWYQRARDKGHPDAQSHLDKLKQKQDQSVLEKAAKEKAAREQATRDQAARERAVQAESAKPVAVETGDSAH